VGGLLTEGTILGTLSYMAPEQIDGRDVDTRGRVRVRGRALRDAHRDEAFEGESPARVMSAILRDEPARVSSIVPVTPAALEALIHACMAKDPNDRWQNISDVARQLRHLRDMMSGTKSGTLPASAVMPQAMRPPRDHRLAARTGWIVAAALGAALVMVVVWRGRSPSLTATSPAGGVALHAVILPPEGMYLTDALALSPDGRRLAFIAAESTGRKHLWVRALDSKLYA
jgi:serine/threonine-protein kinase